MQQNKWRPLQHIRIHCIDKTGGQKVSLYGNSGLEGEVDGQRDFFIPMDPDMDNVGGCAHKGNRYAQRHEGSFDRR